ncbi:hypothetical protein EMIHUDRAFT_241952 [Emiliania huxleyi CCMP1516]|uniref:Uncharacterized protein n=2 Tax=Emiliania huxleyi TaxID=2903 RepID=A0A0D3JAX4_EMIH1|nr:hypothetical protein EMIHUDRAFT_241952 [Emiliania huxleyi CCMP1516]EOD20659.1 hypothetical protein EMIHUDRAFT_241952 [Emiliania huxleyi CCMP1516]|eukprot:XP_005773088.1 hypothetical protein EMIHUDRAFT_241952 [Emiliania huxleyi CCMP1516]
MIVPQEAYPAYLGLDLPAAKSDLFRYCVLFTHGGLWADIDTLPARQSLSPGMDFPASR